MPELDFTFRGNDKKEKRHKKKIKGTQKTIKK